MLRRSAGLAAAGRTTWGFLGAGGIARRRMLPAVWDHPEVAVGAVMVRDQARAEALAAEFGAAAAYDRVDALLADPRLEAIYLATPPALHAAQAIAALEAGKAVLVEKPLAVTTAEAAAMLAAAERTGQRLGVCFPLRANPAVQAIQSWLAAGELGHLVYLRAQLAKWYPLTGDLWRADPRQAGGGVLLDLGSHLLDLAWLLAGPAARITAVLANRAFDVPVEDTACVTVQHESGALAVLELSFAAAGSDNAVEVYGTQGWLTWRSDGDGERLRRVTGGVEEEVRCAATNVYRSELVEFGRAVRSGAGLLAEAADGLRNVAWVEAAYRSARDGLAVRPGNAQGAPVND